MSVNIYLWESDVSEVEFKKSKDILEKSKHRTNDLRIKHLAAWIFKSANVNKKIISTNTKFIIENIDHPTFHPFANPWNKTELQNIFEKTNSTKLIRLSTRQAGVLTISNAIGIEYSKRIKITDKGIILGNFKFKNLNELMEHISINECCFCLDSVNDDESQVLKCGHIFHIKCINNICNQSSICPLCKNKVSSSFLLPKGELSMYTMCIDYDIVNK
jgi:hypothetical protein